MTKYPIIPVDFDVARPIWPETRGRPVPADAKRKAEVVGRAVAALVGGNYMDTAAKFQDEYYAEDSERGVGSSKRYDRRVNQTKYVARKIRDEVRRCAL